VLALGKGFAARRQPVAVGPQTIVGMTAEVRAPGLVFVNGELWRARAEDDSELVPGEEVEVEAVNGLELTVNREAATVHAAPPLD
jgi:membrane protein implicated in regulation of membrane protease activity